MSKVTGSLALARSLLANPQVILAKPAVNWFLLRYLMKFTPTQAGEHLVLHSHLPPVNSHAYSRFINEHLLGRNSGPSHAQVGLTNVCPHNCEYCYNRGRTGEVMDTATVLQVIRDLKAMGVFWLGFTGGEPLLREDLVKITESAADGCAVKMFTTGATLTRELAAGLQRAGLFSVSVSLDHWRAAEHDRVRGCPGAHQAGCSSEPSTPATPEGSCRSRSGRRPPFTTPASPKTSTLRTLPYSPTRWAIRRSSRSSRWRSG